MLFVINQYRILGKAIRFSYKATGTKSDFAPWLKHVIPFGLTRKRTFKHCCFMDRMGLLETSFDNTAKDHVIQVTEKGIEHYFKKKSEYASAQLICLWNLITLILGFVIGKWF